MSNRTKRRLPALWDAIIVLAIWEVVGRMKWVADGALPAPSAILLRFMTDWTDYPPHVLATLQTASIGFLIGNGVAIAAGLLFALWPITLRLAAGINVAIFAVPPIAIVPLLVVTLDGTTSRILLAALGCYFPTMTATVLGLTHVDQRAVDVVRAYGAGPISILRLVRLPNALPVILGGLRVAAPNAVLGAILGEFGGGGRWGLGAYLLGSLGRAQPDRLWDIGLMATLMAGLAYALFSLLANRTTKGVRAVTMAPSAAPSSPESRLLDHGVGRVITLVLATVLPFGLWWISVMHLSPVIAKTPALVIDYLFTGPTAAAAQEKLLPALAQTVPIALLGMGAGLMFAFGLAIVGVCFPRVIRSILPVALVTQTMPLVALTPLLVLIAGRGVTLIIVVTISVTFFPAFVTMAQGLALVPRSALDLIRAYGGGWWAQLRFVSVTSALPYLFAAARLAAPRALLGVMIAEWLATGTGLGNLLNRSRAYLDYGMIWSIATLAVLIAVVFHILVTITEHRILKRMGMR